MNKIIMIIASIMLLTGIIAAAAFNFTGISAKSSDLTPSGSSTCGGSCTKTSSCGSSTCGASTTGTCGCAKAASVALSNSTGSNTGCPCGCGGKCGGTCGSSSCTCKK